MENDNNNTPPSCSVSGSGTGSGSGARARGRGNGAADAAADGAELQVAAPPEHNIFGDSNLNVVMMVMLVLHFMQYAMRPPCGC